ncbi:MAG: hypothetical protein QM747_20350 [Nocardioides sp.]
MADGRPELVPSVFDGTANTIAVVVLLLEFLMLRSALLRAQVRLYAAQSLGGEHPGRRGRRGRDVPELYALAALSFALKAVIVPSLILRLMRDASTEIAGSGALGVASEIMSSIVGGGVRLLHRQRPRHPLRRAAGRRH